MADCNVIFAIGTGADDPLRGATLQIRRVNVGTKGNLEVLSAWKPYVLADEATSIPLVQGVAYEANVVGIVGGSKAFEVPAASEVYYKDLERLYPLPPGEDFGPQGVSIVAAAQPVPGQVVFELSNGATTTPVTLPVGPAGPNTIPAATFIGSEIGTTGTPAEVAVTAKIAALAGKPLTDVPSIASANGALVVGKHNPVDATGAARAMTLADASGAGQLVSIEKVDASVNAVTVSLKLRGTAGSISLSYQRETLLFLSKADGSWWPVAGHRTKTSIDDQISASGALSGPRGELEYAETNVATVVNSTTGVNIPGLDITVANQTRPFMLEARVPFITGSGVTTLVFAISEVGGPEVARTVMDFKASGSVPGPILRARVAANRGIKQYRARAFLDSGTTAATLQNAYPSAYLRAEGV